MLVPPFEPHRDILGKSNTPPHAPDYEALRASAPLSVVPLTLRQCQQYALPYAVQFRSSDSDELADLLAHLGVSVSNEFTQRIYDVLGSPLSIDPKDFEYNYSSPEQLSLFFEEQLLLHPVNGVKSVATVTLSFSDISKVNCQLLDSDELGEAVVLLTYSPFPYASSERDISWEKTLSLLAHFDAVPLPDQPLSFCVEETHPRAVTLAAAMNGRLTLTVKIADPQVEESSLIISDYRRRRGVPSMLVLQDLTGPQCREIFEALGCQELGTLLSTGALKHLIDVVSEEEDLLPANLTNAASKLPNSLWLNCRRELELGDDEPEQTFQETLLPASNDPTEFENLESSDPLEFEDTAGGVVEQSDSPFEEDEDYDDSDVEIESLETNPSVIIPSLNSRFGPIDCRLSPIADHDCGYVIDLTQIVDDEDFSFRQNQLLPYIEIVFKTDQTNPDLATPNQVEDLWNALRKVLSVAGYEKAINRIKRACHEKRKKGFTILVAILGPLTIEVDI